MKTKKEFSWRGKCYRWIMTGWQAILLVAAEVAICAWSFIVLVYLSFVINAIF